MNYVIRNAKIADMQGVNCSHPTEDAGLYKRPL